ncbi:unnamed protein product [Dracunculus medinensis]|uniref:Lig_chan-Glu_bd domain-containing protein n=1 Tax=Dracunculus medinensis TaxID=318479 RepID=A0A0N4UCU6_DRAME|nr:unnamed protein product [Dracunculus medinensis]
MIKNSYQEDEELQLEGFCIDLLAQLSHDLGFTYTINLVKDKKYGIDEYGNGSWTGMIGEILRGEADIAVAPLTVNFKRSEVVDFTKPFLSIGISILYKIPQTNKPELFSSFNPLTVETWICFLLAFRGSLFIKFFKISRRIIKSLNRYVLSTMLKGGCDFGPRAVSTRLLGGTWWVFTLIIIAAYTANLAAVLTVSKQFISIKNLDDLANQSKIAYGALEGGSTIQVVSDKANLTHMKIWKYMKSHNNIFMKSNAKGVEKVLNEDYAFLMESTSLEYEVQQNCNLTQIGGVLGSKGYSIALQKRTDCTRINSPVTQKRVALNLNNIRGLFIVLFAGLALAYLIVLIECFLRWYKRYGNNKTVFFLFLSISKLNSLTIISIFFFKIFVNFRTIILICEYIY